MTSGSMLWPIRRSFVAYVGALPDGHVTVEDGATVDDDGSFSFPAIDSSGHFGGAVRFRGHSGLLDTAIVEPAVEQLDGRTVLTTRIGDERYAIADVRPDRLVLADDGIDVFGGFYPAGTILNPIRISIPDTTEAR